MAAEVRYPRIQVQLTGGSGNASVIIGTVMRALRRARVPQAEITEFMDEARSGDYDHVLITCMRWVDVS